jgi:PhnB protein
MNDTLTLPERPEVVTKRNVSPIPAAYHSVTPYLIVKGAAKAIEFYKEVFGASEMMRMPGPNGTIVHAEIKIGDSPVMLADEMPGMEFKSAASLGGSPVGLLLYVEDVDACAARAVAAGATEMRAVQNQFYGDRSGTYKDPFGQIWTISTHIEDVSAEELRRRMSEMKPCGQC